MTILRTLNALQCPNRLLSAHLLQNVYTLLWCFKPMCLKALVVSILCNGITYGYYLKMTLRKYPHSEMIELCNIWKYRYSVAKVLSFWCFSGTRSSKLLLMPWMMLIGCVVYYLLVYLTENFWNVIGQFLITWYVTIHDIWTSSQHCNVHCSARKLSKTTELSVNLLLSVYPSILIWSTKITCPNSFKSIFHVGSIKGKSMHCKSS